MNSSGIKRGLAASAVAGLAVAMVPCLAANADTANITGITIAPDVTTASTGENVTFTVKSTNAANAGEITTTPLVVTITEPSGLTTSAQIGEPITTTSLTTPTPDAVYTDNKYEVTGTLATASSQGSVSGSFKVKSTLPGTVTVKVAHPSDPTISSTTQVVVGGGKADANDAKSLTATIGATSAYQADVAALTAKVSPRDAAGFGVATALTYSIDGGTPASVSTTTGDYTKTISLAGHDTVGAHTLKVWVNQSGAGTFTGGADAGEPVQTLTYTVLANPAVSNSYSTTAVTTPFPGSTIPSGEPLNATLTATVKDSSDKPLAGVRVRFQAGAAGTLLGSAVSGADGVAKLVTEVPFFLTYSSLAIKAYVSQTDTANSGTQVGSTQTLTPAARVVAITTTGATSVQATKNGTVTVPILVADQFGKPKANQVINAVVTGRNTTVATTAAPIQITTDAAGKATLTYKDTGSASVPDQISFTNTTTTTVPVATNLVSVTFINSVAPATVEISDVSTSWRTVGHWTTGNYYQVRVLNADGVALTNQSVTFATNLGFLAKGSSATTGDKSVTLTTDGGGYAGVYVGSTQAGDQVVTATAGSVSKTFSKYEYSADDAYSLTTNTIGEIANGGSAKVTAKVTDKFGNPVWGADVYVDQDGVGSLAGGVSFVEAETNSKGEISFTLQGGTTAGSGSVSVEMDNYYSSDETDATVARYKAPVVVNYTVAAVPVIVTPTPTPTPTTAPTTAPPAVIKIVKAIAKNKGKKDVVTVVGSNGAKVTLYKLKNGKKVKVKSAIVKGGKATFKVKDKNGKKKTTYVASFGSTSFFVTVK